MSSGKMGTPPRKPCARLALRAASSSSMAMRFRKSRDGGFGCLGAEASSFPRRPRMFPLGIGDRPAPGVRKQPRPVVGEAVGPDPHLALRVPLGAVIARRFRLAHPSSPLIRLGVVAVVGVVGEATRKGGE